MNILKLEQKAKIFSAKDGVSEPLSYITRPQHKINWQIRIAHIHTSYPYKIGIDAIGSKLLPDVAEGFLVDRIYFFHFS